MRTLQFESLKLTKKCSMNMHFSEAKQFRLNSLKYTPTLHCKAKLNDLTCRVCFYS